MFCLWQPRLLKKTSAATFAKVATKEMYSEAKKESGFVVRDYQKLRAEQ